MPQRKKLNGFAEAERRIAEAARAGSDTLDLAGLRLTSVPETIGQLAKLQRIDLDSNQITNIPETLGQLADLQVLDLRSNQITRIPEELGQLTNLQYLLLESNQITNIPEELGQLTNLRSLDLDFNQITNIPETLGQLTNLQYLYLPSNQIANFPETLGQLTNLQDLDLAHNQITNIPETLGQLANLQNLYLYSNQITNIPETLGRLANLKSLYLQCNQITNIPEALGQLANLQNLYLYSNQVTNIPETLGQLANLQYLDLGSNRLTNLPRSLRQLVNLKGLFVHDNPGLKLPQSVLGPTYDAWVTDGRKLTKVPQPGPILDYYFRTRNTVDQRPLGEAKLILVGRGEVGKTSLVKRLVENKFSRREDRTQGIRIKSWPLDITTKEQVRLHVWDFGGQEIMHATHQFFLTDRSVYLLVLDGRAGLQEAQADYWLRIIGSFASESPVIVVLNKFLKDPFDLNRRALQEKYPQVKGFIETDCDNPDTTGKCGIDGHGIDKLQKLIIREIKQMPDVRAVFPASWFEIKERLSKTKRNYMAFDDYRQFCEKYGEPDAGAQESLATHLHRLGIALNYRDDPRLRDTHVLNPHWVTEGIYCLLNSKSLAASKGEFDVTDLPQVLEAQKYPPDMHQFLLDLMEKFELCFNFPNGKRYLIPELLAPQQPEAATGFDRATCLNFQYHYPVIPSGLLPRFIVRTHTLTEKQPRWRTGVILEFQGNTALVKADLQENKVFILVNGPMAGRRRMLAMIREDFEAIHRDIKHLNPAEMVALPNHPQIVIPYRHLEVLERKNPQAEWQQVVDDDVISVPVRELLDGVELKDQAARAKDDRQPISELRGKKGIFDDRPLRVFYSYARVDGRHRLMLSKHLAPLKRLGLITDWYDHEILGGEEWAQEIAAKLEEADIVLLLISPDFVSSAYCYEIELKAAMEKDPTRSAVIPIVVRSVNAWKKLPLGKLKALPQSSVAIADWKSRDKGWADVAEGIENKANDLLKREREDCEPL